MTKLEEVDAWLRGASRGDSLFFSKDERKAIVDELDRLREDLARIRELAAASTTPEHREAMPPELEELLFPGTERLPYASVTSEADELRAELAALKGEAERTVYVESDGPKGAISEALAGFSFASEQAPGLNATHAVRLSATRVKP